ATMAALVLSLLLASAKSGFDARRDQLAQLSADIVLLDRELAHYGSEARQARSLLRNSVGAMVQRYWPIAGASSTRDEMTRSPVEALYDTIESLSPANDDQRALRGRALTMAVDVGRRIALLVGNLGSSIPLPFLV